MQADERSKLAAEILEATEEARERFAAEIIRELIRACMAARLEAAKRTEGSNELTELEQLDGVTQAISKCSKRVKDYMKAVINAPKGTLIIPPWAIVGEYWDGKCKPIEKSYVGSSFVEVPNSLVINGTEFKFHERSDEGDEPTIVKRESNA